MGKTPGTNGGGVIINISSTAGTNPQKDTPVYSVAKAGLIMLTSMLSQVSEEYKAALSQMIPLKRAGQPIDIAKAVIFHMKTLELLHSDVFCRAHY